MNISCYVAQSRSSILLILHCNCLTIPPSEEISGPSAEPRICSLEPSRAQLTVWLSILAAGHSIHFLCNVPAEHYQAFAGALPHHAELQSHLEVTQSQIKEARTALQEAKDSLGSKRADLVQLWSRSQTVDEMMRILDQMCV